MSEPIWLYREVSHKDFMDQLEAWGYNPRTMSISGWDESGYDEFEVSETSVGSVKLARVFDGMPIVNRCEWKSPEHYEFVKYAVIPLPNGGNDREG